MEGVANIMDINRWKRSQFARRSLFERAALGTAGLAGAVLAACGGKGRQESVPPGPPAAQISVPSATVTSPPRQGGTVRLGGTAANVDTADIHQSVSVQGQQTAQWAIDTLQCLDEPVPAQFKQIPQLAETLEQPDDLTYIYKVRKGVRFHDVPPVNGREFTAEDAVFSLKRMATNDPRFTRRSWLEKVTSIEALDPATLRLKTSEPVASLSYLLASPWVGMIAKEQAERDGEKLKSFIGTGPYLADRYEPGSIISFTRNPKLSGPGGYFDKVEVVQIPDPQAWAAAFRADEVQELSTIPADTLANLKRQVPTALQYKTPSSGIGVVAFNNRRNPYGDVRVRRAIALACDIPGWIQTIVGGEGLITGPIAPQFVDWALPASKLKFHTQNVAESKKLLDAAGVQPASLSIKALTIGNLPTWVAAATQFQADMKAIGISVQIEPVSNTEYTTRFFASNDFEVVVGSDFSPDDPDRLYDRLHSKGSGNYSGYANADVDRLLTQQRTTLNREQRRQLLTQAQEIVVDEAPTFYTYIPWNFVMATERLANWRVSAISGNQMRWNARNAWFKS